MQVTLNLFPTLLSPFWQIVIERRIYPVILLVSFITFLIVMQMMQFSRLYEHIKNDKYLVGKRLVNYYHSQGKDSSSVTSSSSSSTNNSGSNPQNVPATAAQPQPPPQAPAAAQPPQVH